MIFLLLPESPFDFLIALGEKQVLFRNGFFTIFFRVVKNPNGFVGDVFRNLLSNWEIVCLGHHSGYIEKENCL